MEKIRFFYDQAAAPQRRKAQLEKMDPRTVAGTGLIVMRALLADFLSLKVWSPPMCRECTERKRARRLRGKNIRQSLSKKIRRVFVREVKLFTAKHVKRKDFKSELNSGDEKNERKLQK